MEILGYSSYWHSNQNSLLEAAYKAKSAIVRDAQKGGNYGSGLTTILVFYNFEVKPGEFADTHLLKKRVEVQRYNSKEKSLRINVFVGFSELLSKSYEEQIDFYYHTTMEALLKIQFKFVKRPNPEVKIDFNKLFNDVKLAYLKVFSDLNDQ